MADYTLWGYYRSSAAYRVRIALNLKAIAYEHEFISLVAGAQHQPEFREISPQEMVPVLEISQNARKAFLTQSLAIIEFIDEQYPDPPLIPGNAFARAKIRASANLIACDIHPINVLRVLNYLRQDIGLEDTLVNGWIHHWISQGFSALETMIDGEPFCFGNTPTLADICLMPQLYNARRFGVPLDRFQKIVAIEARCLEIPAFFDAHPDRQPDAA